MPSGAPCQQAYLLSVVDRQRSANLVDGEERGGTRRTSSGAAILADENWSDPVSVNTSDCGEKTGLEPDDCREWGDSGLQDARKSTQVALSPNEFQEQDSELPLA